MPEANYSFLQVGPLQVTPTLRGLFDPSDPASLRCFAVLDGHAAGKIFTDNPEYPDWAVVQESAFGSLYLAGDLRASLLQQLLNDLRLAGDVLIGLWPDDPRWSLLPSTFDYSGRTLEFTDRETEPSLAEIPAGCRLLRLNQTLIKQILGRNLLIHIHGNVQQALEWGYGVCLLRDDDIEYRLGNQSDLVVLSLW